MERSRLLDIDHAEVEAELPHDVIVPALNPDFVTRQEAARLAVVNLGIEWPKTILPEGTALYESGVKRLKSDRARWAKLPFANDALPVVKAAPAAEDRRDDLVAVRDLGLDSKTGKVVYTGQDGSPQVVGYDRHAFSQLIAQTSLKDAPRGAAGTLLFLRPDERAAILNDRVGDSFGKVTARTKATHNGQRVARAFLSSRYADVNDIHVAEGIEAALNGDAKIARLDYKPGDERSRFEVFFPAEIPVETFVVGDVHRALVVIENSETGEGAIRVTAGVVRALCANLTLGSGVVSIRHSGNAEHRRIQTKAAIREALALLDPLVQAITASARSVIPADESPSSIIFALAKKYEVREERAEAWLKTYESSYAHSPTAWGISSAISESAQSLDWWTEQAEEEKVASQLVHVRWDAVKPSAKAAAN